MILVCPCCGASASIEAWANDRDWRDLMTLLPAIPAQLQAKAISYLGLWRSGKRALKPAKAAKILTDLIDLVAAGTIHWDGGETRPAPIELWAKALDAVLERRPQALTSHNYLKHTAWEMAAGLAATLEREMEKKRLHRAVNEQEETPASEEERAAVAAMLKGFTGRWNGGRANGG
jgi:hypothetical protein